MSFRSERFIAMWSNSRDNLTHHAVKWSIAFHATLSQLVAWPDEEYQVLIRILITQVYVRACGTYGKCPEGVSNHSVSRVGGNGNKVKIVLLNAKLPKDGCVPRNGKFLLDRMP